MDKYASAESREYEGRIFFIVALIKNLSIFCNKFETYFGKNKKKFTWAKMLNSALHIPGAHIDLT